MMDVWLKPAAEIIQFRDTHATVAVIAVSGSQIHTGILYRKNNSAEPRLVHLEWHFRLNDEIFSLESGYFLPHRFSSESGL